MVSGFPHVSILFISMVESGIYVIVNTNNGKIYVGSSKNVRKRRNRHFSELRRCRRRGSGEYDRGRKDHQSPGLLHLPGG